MPIPCFENKQKKLQEIIMVNHAGEYGAQCIYEGQLAYIQNIESKILIKKMLQQELEHLHYFEQQIQTHNGKPTIFIPLWKIFGYALGAFSASLGTKIAMLVTESVEEVIIDHYQEQIIYIEKTNPNNSILQKLKKFKQDESNHMHIAIENASNNVPCYQLLSIIIRSFCRTAIFISKKI